MIPDFTYASYRELIAAIKALGYPIGAFYDFPTSGPGVILRHDIDFSLEKALEMATLDADLRVRSSFFVLLTAPYYNPLSAFGQRVLKEISLMGHEIGLHCDLSCYKKFGSEERRQLIAQAKTLETHLDVRISAVAQHKPGLAPMNIELDGFVNAYSAPYFHQIGYLSDSRMMFREPNLLSFLRRHSRCQILLHPIWWDNVRKTRSEVLCDLRRSLGTRLDELLAAEEQVIDEYLVGASGT